MELGEKGQGAAFVRKKQLKPLRELCVLRGTLQEVLEQREHAKDFVSITLTDEEEPYMPKEQLELVFDHILEIRIDNERTRRILDLYEEEEETESLFESFASFFETVQGRSMNEAEQEAAQDAWNEIIEGEQNETVKVRDVCLWLVCRIGRGGFYKSRKRTLSDHRGYRSRKDDDF